MRMRTAGIIVCKWHYCTGCVAGQPSEYLFKQGKAFRGHPIAKLKEQSAIRAFHSLSQIGV